MRTVRRGLISLAILILAILKRILLWLSHCWLSITSLHIVVTQSTDLSAVEYNATLIAPLIELRVLTFILWDLYLEVLLLYGRSPSKIVGLIQMNVILRLTVRGHVHSQRLLVNCFLKKHLAIKGLHILLLLLGPWAELSGIMRQGLLAVELRGESFFSFGGRGKAWGSGLAAHLFDNIDGLCLSIVGSAVRLRIEVRRPVYSMIRDDGYWRWRGWDLHVLENFFRFL